MRPYRLSVGATEKQLRVFVVAELADHREFRSMTTEQRAEALFFLEEQCRLIAARDHPEVDPRDYAITMGRTYVELKA